MCGCGGNKATGPASATTAPATGVAGGTAPGAVVWVKHTHFFWYVIAFAIGVYAGRRD